MTEHTLNTLIAGLPVAAWMIDAQGFFTATTAFLATCWYVRLFYLAWRADHVGPKGDKGDTGAAGKDGQDAPL